MTKEDMTGETTRRMVQEHYGRVAESSSCCGSSSCCSGEPKPLDFKDTARRLGYSDQELARLPENANLGLGCGNPLAIALLKEGETVLDLGSGAGMDCFLATAAVGSAGHVIGVDMTPEMLHKARSNIGNRTNIEFRLGEIEHLPVADNAVDVILSNCVINLSPDKQQVFNEAFRILRPGGRLAISDVVQTKSFQGTKWAGAEHISACIAGSITVEHLDAMLQKAGFSDVRIVLNESSREFIKDWDPGTGIEGFLCSAIIEARKRL